MHGRRLSQSSLPARDWERSIIPRFKRVERSYLTTCSLPYRPANNELGTIMIAPADMRRELGDVSSCAPRFRISVHRARASIGHCGDYWRSARATFRRLEKRMSRPAARSSKRVPKAYDRDQIARPLINAYVQLAATRPKKDGSRALTVGQSGSAEIHPTGLPVERASSPVPPLWFEVFSRDDGATIDGYECFNLNADELVAAVELILDLRRRCHYHS
jgi:hypothetical protein